MYNSDFTSLCKHYEKSIQSVMDSAICEIMKGKHSGDTASSKAPWEVNWEQGECYGACPPGIHYWNYYPSALSSPMFEPSHCNSSEKWAPADFTGFQRPLAVPLHSTNSRQMPAVRAVQGDPVIVYNLRQERLTATEQSHYH